MLYEAVTKPVAARILQGGGGYASIKNLKLIGGRWLWVKLLLQWEVRLLM